MDIYGEPIVLIVPASAVVPSGTPTAPEWIDIQNRVSAIEGMELGDLANVSESGKATGMVLAVLADGSWAPVTKATGIVRVTTNWNANDVPNATLLTLGQGLDLNTTWAGDGRAHIAVVFGTAANTIAMGNHTHAVYAPQRSVFSASGTLSSGARSLVSGTRTGLIADNSYRIWAMLRGDLRGEGTGAGYTQASVTISGTTVNRSGLVRTVSGVDREFGMMHPGVTVTGVTSVTFNAELSYDSGDPINVGAGELTVFVEANR